MRKLNWAGIILLVLVVASVCISYASAECAACRNSAGQQDVLNNEWAIFMGKEPSEVPLTTATGLTTAKDSRNNNVFIKSKDTPAASAVEEDKVDSKAGEGGIAPKTTDIVRSANFAKVLVSPTSVGQYNIILDISPAATEYIPGSINIPYTEFVNEDKSLRSASEIAQILGDAGISENDCVVITGECQPCGGGSGAADFTYFAMKYLGHECVALLDGGIDAWVAAKEQTVTTPATLSPKSYQPAIKPELLATYEYVKSGQAQIVDARSKDEFNAGSLPAAISIPYESLQDGKRLKDESAINDLFATLDRNRPVVVFSETGVKASLNWLALTLTGHDARLYTYQNWLANQPRLNITLQEGSVKADPNPAKTGDVVKITAIFEEETQTAAKGDGGSKSGVNASNETVLTIKGCATCGFGSPQGFADLSKNSGVVQIGSSSKTKMPDSGFSVVAMIQSPSGDNVARVIMKRVSGDEFAGIWNANVAAGKYKVNIVASAGEISKTFPDVLEIEVTGTSKFKNLGK
jgi:thiosulfate/3-mercaptopyruvate sulfurtransferase